MTTPPTDPRFAPSVFVTADVPGIGGRIRERPEDFLVDELPLYPPSGSGEHIMLFVQKRDLSTLEMVRILARHFRVRVQAVGYAGQKDKVAVTRQHVTIHAPGKTCDSFPMVADSRISILWADQHANKLRIGHLRGNRFSIRIRGVAFADALRARDVLRRLREVGVPNRIGEQRFGASLNNHLVGRAILRNEPAEALRELLAPAAAAGRIRDAAEHFRAGRLAECAGSLPRSARVERAAAAALARGEDAAAVVRRIEPDALRFFLSAFQSAVFNAVLDERVASGTFGTLLPGDLAMKHDNRATFPADEETAADPETAERLRRFEISPTGPMWGSSMRRASGAIDEAETAALASFGVAIADLERFSAARPAMVEGVRRPLRVPLADPEVEGGVDEHGPFVRVAFDLPRGAFATVVLREIMKSPAPAADEPESA